MFWLLFDFFAFLVLALGLSFEELFLVDLLFSLFFLAFLLLLNEFVSFGSSLLLHFLDLFLGLFFDFLLVGD